MGRIYIPNKLFVRGDATATVNHIAAHEQLFHFGIVSDLACGIVLIFLVLAFYRLFQGVDRHLAVLVVIFGGIMPGLINFIEVVDDAAVLTVLHGGDLLSAFNVSQRNSIAMLFLNLRNQQNTAAEMLWGIWLLPLALLVYRSHFLPRFLSFWLTLNGIAYVILSLTGELLPQYQTKVFTYAQPALFGELAIMLWLIIKGARPLAREITALI